MADPHNPHNGKAHYPQQGVSAKQPPHPVAALSEAQKNDRWGKIKLPQLLCDEAALIMFDFWERQKPLEHQLLWSQLSPAFQTIWRQAARVALEMGATVILEDAIHFVDKTNGDMGGAYAKAIRRYINERLA